MTKAEKKHFEKQMKLARKIVASWPAWKRNYLENSGKATCPPRKPVINDDGY